MPPWPLCDEGPAPFSSVRMEGAGPVLVFGSDVGLVSDSRKPNYLARHHG